MSEIKGSSQPTEKKFSDQLSEVWSVVEKSRHPQRPHSLDYIHKVFIDFEELKGDRCFGEDAAIIAGMAELRGEKDKFSQSVFILAHQKGRNTKQKIERNFGMARPEGYRKAMRIFELAERFNKPVIALIDTPGAFPGVGAEERGQSVAIAQSILKMFELKVPSISLVIGEGGSGGALAVGVADRVLMLENSIYSVISPESCAAILWGTASESKRAALALKMSAKETFELGLCDEVIAEGGSGAHENPDEAASAIKAAFIKNLQELLAMDPQTRAAKKYEKFRHIDARQLSR
jgi:acetyl-CoA carboxylase carboxyl transferase subunit alpha